MVKTSKPRKPTKKKTEALKAKPVKKTRKIGKKPEKKAKQGPKKRSIKVSKRITKNEDKKTIKPRRGRRPNAIKKTTRTRRSAKAPAAKKPEKVDKKVHEPTQKDLENLKSLVVESDELSKLINHEHYFESFTEFIETNKLKVDEKIESLGLISYLLVSLCSSTQKKSDFLFSAFNNSKGMVFNQLIMLLSKGRHKEIDEFLAKHVDEKRELIHLKKTQIRMIREDKENLNCLRN